MMQILEIRNYSNKIGVISFDILTLGYSIKSDDVCNVGRINNFCEIIGQCPRGAVISTAVRKKTNFINITDAYMTQQFHHKDMVLYLY